MKEDIQKYLQSMDFLQDWDTWRNSLKEALEKAKKLGMSDEAIKNLYAKIDYFLATKICPLTREERLLKEMWKVADASERKVVASIIFKI
jgi:sulfur relay (sulfurtransferase) DsrC/TusE family protein